METAMQSKVGSDRKIWFSMWFLAAIVTFGLAFFPMFYRLIEGRNKHFQREAKLENQVAAYLRSQGKEPPATSEHFTRQECKGVGCQHHFGYSSFRHRLPFVQGFSWCMSGIRKRFLRLLFQNGCL